MSILIEASAPFSSVPTATRTDIKIKKLVPALGAVIEGIDLSVEQDDATVATVAKALEDNLVIFFENQHITPVQQRDFAKRFGELYQHPLYPGQDGLPDVMVIEYTAERKGHNDVWHTDVTYIQTPPKASLLYAETIPEIGGDTIWVNTYLAYEALSEPMRNLVSKLSAVHDFSQAFGPERFAEYGIAERAMKAYEENPPVTHPMVRTNVATGRKALFVNQNFTSHIAGVPKAESKAILDFLYAHIMQPEFQVRWRWSPNAVAFWDNRFTQHYAIADYFPNYRRMRRATILGDRPV